MDTISVFYRRAWPEDAAAMALLRYSMFLDMGSIVEADAGRDDFLETAEHFYSISLGSRDEYTVVAESAGEIVACGSAQFQMRPPRPNASENNSAYILSIYVMPEFRRRGIARSIMEALHGECAKRKVVRASLHASEAGKILYEKMGYENSPKYLEIKF